MNNNFAFKLAAAAMLATYTNATLTLVACDAGMIANVGGVDKTCDPGGTAIAAGFTPTDVIIDSFKYTAGTTVSEDVNTLSELTIKWRGTAATDCFDSTNKDTAKETGKTTLTGTADKLNWINQWITNLKEDATKAKKKITGFTIGVQEITNNTTYLADSKSKQVAITSTTAFAGTASVSATKKPLGPIVQFKVKTKKYVDTI